ncbi:MAG: VOC family protein [Firmicutes bacterium]|nr:VOC family protein [Bacillota bacterium]
MDKMSTELGFKVLHFGVNCDDEQSAKKVAVIFGSVFGLPLKEGKSSIFAGPLIELMKGSGRGRCGHIAIGTNDLDKARKYLEDLGMEFDDHSVKYDSEGKPILIYLKEEIAGFAVHLLLEE